MNTASWSVKKPVAAGLYWVCKKGESPMRCEIVVDVRDGEPELLLTVYYGEGVVKVFWLDTVKNNNLWCPAYGPILVNAKPPVGWERWSTSNGLAVPKQARRA